MPARHGLFQEEEKPLFMRFGILGIFNLIQMQTFNEPLSGADAAAHGVRCQFLQGQRIHSSEVAQRLLDSIDTFQEYMADLDSTCDLEGYPITYTSMQRRAGMAADAVLQYLGILLDGIGRLVPMVILEDPAGGEGIHSFQKAMNAAKRGGDYAEVQDLFAELDAETSWWKLGFEYGLGLRQRITHYPDLIMFQRSGIVGGKMQTFAFLQHAFGVNRSTAIDIMGAFTRLFHDVCEWLDRLEQILFRSLSVRAARIGSVLAELPIHGFWLPVNHTGELQLYRANYLYMPFCENSLAPRHGITWRWAVDQDAEEISLPEAGTIGVDR